jgi:AraC-like DNA-binding protein
MATAASINKTEPSTRCIKNSCLSLRKCCQILGPAQGRSRSAFYEICLFPRHWRENAWEAKAARSDASQTDVPVLTIAMDAGFQSIGPFNRAFKADTGLTPTEFRRLTLAKSESNPLDNNGKFEIGQSG